MSKQPNILIFMADQLSGTLFPDGPAEFLHVPNLRRLSERAVNFTNSYCASPLCVPSRAAFMTGRLTSRIGTYDNAAEFAPSVPTFAHYLRYLGYRTALAGKMHFVGPDQLHGFEQRLTTDVYPADFGWTPDWTKPNDRIDWWYHNMGSVTGAGTGQITNQLEFDDDVAHYAKLGLHQFVRSLDQRPFCLTVSFTHPHDPYVTRRKYWDLYPEHRLPAIAVPPIPYDEQDPHSQRILRANDFRNFDVTEQNIIDSRRAYFGNVSYVDDKIGEILEVLTECRLEDDTVILLCADHGDMLGERGLWFKMSFFEGSNRVPLLLYAPERLQPRNIAEPASLLDVLPTLVELAGGNLDALQVDSDGTSLLDSASGGAAPKRPILTEYAAEGSIDPMVMIREGQWKYSYCEQDPPQLFDLAADPHERHNLASDPAHAGVAARMQDQVNGQWDIACYREEVLRSQRQRLLVYQALRKGDYYPWDHQPVQKASERFMRNHLDLNVLEANARFPRVEE